MTFGDTLQATKEGLQCALDDVCILADGMRRLTRRAISSSHLAPRHIINPKPYKNWNTFSLRPAVPLESRIARKTIKIVSLHCNTRLNAMVGYCYGRSIVLHTNRCILFAHSVPSKLLSWITLATLRLEAVTNKGLIEGECDHNLYAANVS
jgi:hypothetical protein